MLLKFKQKLFALDIGQRSFKLIQLKKYNNKARIITSGSITIPANIFENHKIVKFDEFAQLIKTLLKNCQGQKIISKHVTVCLPEPLTFIKLITLTYPESKNTLEEIIDEAKKHIPYPLESTFLDWQFADEQDKSKILIAVCPKDIVNNYQEALTKAGLIPLALEIEAAAICRCLLPPNEIVADPLMILDLGATRTSLITYQNQTVLFSLSLKFSLDLIFDLLKSKLKFSPAECERVMKLCGLDPKKASGGVRKILEPLLAELARQIREAKYFYHEHFSKEKEINRLLLTGGGCQLYYLPNYLEEKCKLKVEIANSFVNLLPGNYKSLDKNLNIYTTAIGLALRYI